MPTCGTSVAIDAAFPAYTGGGQPVQKWHGGGFYGILSGAARPDHLYKE